MKVFLICVNYNSMRDLMRYVESIRKAALHVKGMQLHIVVADNSSGSDPVDVALAFELLEANGNLEIIKQENLGYFPTASRAWEASFDQIKDCDYSIVSNVDLGLAENFFVELNALQPDPAVGVLAPAVISRRGADLNPKIWERPRRSQLIKTERIFRCLPLYLVYVALSNAKYKIRGASQRCLRASQIYAPHGAIIVFTAAYVREVKGIAYPRFLYGEEIFVAEECRRNNLEIRYEPTLRVNDFDHGSTSMKSAGFKAAEHAKSLGYLLDTYF